MAQQPCAYLVQQNLLSFKVVVPDGCTASYGWTQECSSLRVFLVVGNPKNFMAYISDRLDGTPGLRTCELGTEWYHDLLVRGHLFHLVLLVSFDHAWQMVALTITLQHLHHQTF